MFSDTGLFHWRPWLSEKSRQCESYLELIYFRYDQITFMFKALDGSPHGVMGREDLEIHTHPHLFLSDSINTQKLNQANFSLRFN